jgi:Rieske Fe-S protein
MGPPVEERRSFLAWVINGLGAILAAILGFPIVCYLIDPRNRQGNSADFKLADGVRLQELTPTHRVMQGAIRDVRRDAYTLHPNDVLGRVWVVLQKDEEMPDAEGRKRLSSHDANGRPRTNLPIKVFTTICPHLGCAVNLAPDGNSFACPCHSATFESNGVRATDHNPARRGMDELEWQVDPSDPEANRLLVKYRNFRSSIPEKTEVN